MDTNNFNNRRRTRVHYKTKVVINCDGVTEKITGKSTDISMNGIFIKTDQNVPLRTPCHVSLILKGKNSLLTMDINGKVMRKTPDGLGVQFDDDLEWWAIFSLYQKYSEKV